MKQVARPVPVSVGPYEATIKNLEVDTSCKFSDFYADYLDQCQLIGAQPCRRQRLGSYMRLDTRLEHFVASKIGACYERVRKLSFVEERLRHDYPNYDELYFVQSKLNQMGEVVVEVSGENILHWVNVNYYTGTLRASDRAGFLELF